MTFFPCLMYYLWICLWFYDGKLVYPTSSEDIKPFLGRMWAHIAKVESFLLFRACTHPRNRMPAPTSMHGRCTPATSSSNLRSPSSSPATRRRVSLSHHWATRRSCTTATPLPASTSPWSHLPSSITFTSSVSLKSSITLDIS